MSSAASRFVAISLMAAASFVVAQRRTSLAITRLYTGADGEAHAERAEMNMRSSGQRAGLDESVPQKVSGAQFFRWPAGYVWEWHTAARKQYVVTISGRGEVEVAGGNKFPLNPGSVVLAEDVTGKGHTTRVLGSEDLVLLLIPFEAR
jgi:quercetin dioxygenase-like cupin family protein